MTSELLDSLHALIREGRTLEALETFYDEQVVVRENDGTTRKGKQVNITYEEKNLQKVSHSTAELLAVGVDYINEVVFSEWLFQFTNLEGITYQLAEVSVQHWRNSKIVHERFYYKGTERVNAD